ncbi:GIY-YIG nuclease family protein [Acinetobacter sp. CFCC 10889]|uniref:GIY-YIG nuclease family protein n=1 Tax=Acinetobacter sp. CFCC 10889 TaxID=1775557 RepID=UPI000DCFFAB6|nr:GIY-YIG nuclease family protein [Acinetobacter sp. CFCC 10889]
MLLETLIKELNDDSLYRFHLAKTNPDGHRPLDALAKSDDAWLKWQIYPGNKKERFIKNNIVSFAQINGNSFLFGGIFHIKERTENAYKVEYSQQYQDLIGRLIIEYNGDNQRGTVFLPKYIFKNSIIKGIYETRYRGEKFQGFENINHSFIEIEVIVKNKLNDWKAALSSVFGIYLITDTATGMHYIGSAYGEHGIWGRWINYVYNFHGNNKDLIELFGSKGESYIKNHFKFAILEVIPSSKSIDEVITKESLWKKKLLTRQFGYNCN